MSRVHLTVLKAEAAASPLTLSLDAFLLSREAMRCTPKTLDAYRYALGNFAAFLQSQGIHDPQRITPHHIRAYLVSLQRRGLKDTTQHLHARCIKTWLRYLETEGDIAESPMRKVAMPRLEKRIPPPFTPEDIRRLLDGCDRSPLGLRNRAIILTLLDTGLRAAEVVSLTVGALNMRTGLCTVIGKGRKQRTVRVGNKARAAILRYLQTRTEAASGAPLWAAYDITGAESGALSVHGLQIMLQRLGRKVGVLPCGPHRFRRTFALWCVRDGLDLHTLRLMMGHSTLAVLQTYLALAGEDIERAHAAHSPADKMPL